AQGNVLKTGYFAAMVAIDAPEYLEAYKIGFMLSSCTEIMLAAASKLAERPLEQVKDFFAAALFNDAMPQQAQLAANAMSRFPSLGIRESVRVALLANKENVIVPPIDCATLDAWLAELLGRLKEQAERLIEHDGGEGAYKLLKARWPELPGPVKAWMLDWGCRDVPILVLDLLAEGLDSGDAELRLAALRALGSRREFAGLLRDRIERSFGSDDRRLRLAALKAAQETTEEAVTALGDDEESFCLALSKLPATKERELFFLDLLNDGGWRIRSVATRKLMELGVSAEAIRRFEEAPGIGEGARTAVRRIRMSLDGGGADGGA
ncbi:MAG: hypothetical protein Q8M76_16975, partial [Spirochaetaceae bacterium]|nr:hypothetical protein [Spirochaetaceae bacterium]